MPAGDCIPVITITAGTNNVCIDSAVTFKASVVNAGTNAVYKWKKNNQYIANTNSSVYTTSDLRDGDMVNCEYSCITTCGTNFTAISNVITIHVINDITPVITVSNNDSLICEGELTTFTTQASYGNAIPSYQWKLNDKPIPDTLNYYTTDTLTNGSKVECVLTISTPGCPAKRSATSWMAIYVYPMIHPAITITASKTDICRGEPVTFTAIANGGSYPSFAWELNGVPTGDVSASLALNNLKDGDVISCTVTIDQDSRCHTTTSAPSNKVVMHVKDYSEPAIKIDAPLLDACSGTPLSFNATITNPGDYVFYQWLINGKDADGNAPVFVTDKLADGDEVSCFLSTNIPGCSFSAEANSNVKSVIINDTPVIIFSPPDTSVLSGEPALLNAAVSGSITDFMWQPDDILLIPDALKTLTQPLGETTIFKLSVTDINGCKASSDAVVNVLYKMRLPSAFTPNKDGLNDIFRIPPGSSVVLKDFSVYDRWGHILFQTKDIAKGWNGVHNGYEMPAGTYVYFIKGTLDGKALNEKGTVTLVR